MEENLTCGSSSCLTIAIPRLSPPSCFITGGIGGGPNQFNYESEYFASRGMVAVEVEYRLLPEADKGTLPIDCIEDAKSAMRWVKMHAQELGIDLNPYRGGGRVGRRLSGCLHGDGSKRSMRRETT